MNHLGYRIVSGIFAGMFLAAMASAQPSSTDAEQRATEYLAAHYQAPEDYLVSEFKDHDVVFLGEPHMVRQNLLFLQKLLPRLYKAGVYNLTYEMCLSDDQAEMDQLVNTASYDNDKALELMFRWDPQIGWAFQEYADVLRAAWTVNHGLPKGKPRFRVVCADMRPDWSLVKPGDQITSRPTRWKAWQGSNQIARNVWMVNVIRHEVLDKGQKALAYNGFGHTTLAVTRDSREETGLRFSAAYQLRQRFANRITAVQLLDAGADAPGSVGGGLSISNVVAALPEEKRVIGFDLRGTPVGKVPLPEKVAATIVSEKKPPLTYADYPAEGIVQLGFKPEVVTAVGGFITAARVEEAKRGGYLPKVPEIDAEWVLNHQKQFAQQFAQSIRNE